VASVLLAATVAPILPLFLTAFVSFLVWKGRNIRIVVTKQRTFFNEKKIEIEVLGDYRSQPQHRSWRRSARGQPGESRVDILRGRRNGG
jgi:hypothetical protein